MESERHIHKELSSCPCLHRAEWWWLVQVAALPPFALGLEKVLLSVDRTKKGEDLNSMCADMYYFT